MPNFRQLAINPIPRIQQFPLSMLILRQKHFITNFVPPTWKLNNPYYHRVHKAGKSWCTKLQAIRTAPRYVHLAIFSMVQTLAKVQSINDGAARDLTETSRVICGSQCMFWVQNSYVFFKENTQNTINFDYCSLANIALSCLEVWSWMQCTKKKSESAIQNRIDFFVEQSNSP